MLMIKVLNSWKEREFVVLKPITELKVELVELILNQ